MREMSVKLTPIDLLSVKLTPPRDMTLFQNFAQAHRGGSVLILANRLSDMYIHLLLLIPEYELPRATMILSGIWEQIWFPIARPRQASAVLG